MYLCVRENCVSNTYYTSTVVPQNKIWNFHLFCGVTLSLFLLVGILYIILNFKFFFWITCIIVCRYSQRRHFISGATRNYIYIYISYSNICREHRTCGRHAVAGATARDVPQPRALFIWRAAATSGIGTGDTRAYTLHTGLHGEKHTRWPPGIARAVHRRPRWGGSEPHGRRRRPGVGGPLQ